jgi:small GTP-binding protein
MTQKDGFMAESFAYDVFLSHSSKDKDVVRTVAESLRRKGLKVWFDEWQIKPGDNIPAKIEEGLEQSRVLVLFMSANAFASDWAQLEAGTFRFRDPLNKERRLIPLRLDKAPLKGSLAQLLYIEWTPQNRQQTYARLVEACRPPIQHAAPAGGAADDPSAERAIQLPSVGEVFCYAFSADGKRALSVNRDGTVRLWDLASGRCLRVLEDPRSPVADLAWSADGRYAISGSEDGNVRLWDIEAGSCVREFHGHTDPVWAVALGADQRFALSGSIDGILRLWDVKTGDCVHAFLGHTGTIRSVAFSADQSFALSGSSDKTIRLWDVQNGRCLRVLRGHATYVASVAWSANQCLGLSSSFDRTVRLWEMRRGRLLRIFEGHTDAVLTVAWSADQRLALSGCADGTLRMWDVESGACLRVLQGHSRKVICVSWSSDQRRAFSGDSGGGIRVWNVSEYVRVATLPESCVVTLPPMREQVQYANAKVLLVGDTSAGKTALAHRLSTGYWKPSDGSTVGAWSTQWKLEAGGEPDVEREIWLWDFGGQADQRLIHQLYMDRSALILLLFNADQEDALPGLRDWQTALLRCVAADTPQFLVAGRIDTGFKASRSKLLAFASAHKLNYHETSAKEGTGCKELRTAILSSIRWDELEWRTSPQVFKRIKDEILKLRDEGQVLLTFKELRELLWQRLPHEAHSTDETLHTVIALLDGPGVLKELDYGTYILLQPEWVNVYGQAVIRTLRNAETELGCLPMRSIAEGKLLYQSIGRNGTVVEMKRLPAPAERVVLGEMERQLLDRGLCLRQGGKLVFPSHCGRDRPAVVEHPSVFVSYVVNGYLDDIYATLVVKLADSDSFLLKELWRDAADFETLEGNHRMGVKLVRESGSRGDISVYFGAGVSEAEQVIFANYIHAHLARPSEEVQRLRYYVCPKCQTPKGNPHVLMEKLLAKKKAADTECDKCGHRFRLWDGLERKFASSEVRYKIQGLRAEDDIRLDARRKGKLLALEVGARITSADQKCFEIPGTEDEGLDMELEFTDDEGRGTGHRLYLQLKAGNSYVRTRKTDGVEIFTIKKQGWVKYWLKQPHPVMLVIGTFATDRDRLAGKERLEFSEVRWMEISTVIRLASENGTKAVKQIEFKGERLDLSSVRRWRDKILAKVATTA